MNVRVFSIEPSRDANSYDAIVNIGEERHEFKLAVKTVLVADRAIQVTNGDEHFLATFRGNPAAALEISNLVSKVHNNEAIELPADVDGEAVSGQRSGEHFTFARCRLG